jgi:hypothetical protein
VAALACSAPKSCFARFAPGFDDTRILAAAIVALARISFGILVGEHRARRFQHGFADKFSSISSSPSCWRRVSLSMAAAICGSLEKRAVHLCGVVHLISLTYMAGTTACNLLKPQINKRLKQRTEDV